MGLEQMNMRIRPAVYEDASCLSTLSMEVWLHTYAKEGIPKSWADYVLQHFDIEKLRETLSDSQEHIWLAEAPYGKGILGYLRLTETERSYEGRRLGAEIETLYIRHHHKRCGVGAALLVQAIRFAQDQKMSGIFLTVNEENESAIAFYESQGFNEIGEDWFSLNDQRYRNLLMALQLKTQVDQVS